MMSKPQTLTAANLNGVTVTIKIKNNIKFISTNRSQAHMAIYILHIIMIMVNNVIYIINSYIIAQQT